MLFFQYLLTYLFIFPLLLSIACSSGDSSSSSTEKGEAREIAGRKPGRMEYNPRKAATEEQTKVAADTLYRINGTEPFWHMVVVRPRIFYSSMEGDTLLFDYREPRQAAGRQEGHVQVFELGAGQQLLLRSTLPECPCSDGMSDQTYPYQATLILKNKVLEGCGRSLK